MKAATFVLLAITGIGTTALLAEDAADKDEMKAAPTTQPAADKPVNTKCPVSGDAIDPKVTTVYQGKTVAFCCKDCVEDFQKNPEKYMKKLK